MTPAQALQFLDQHGVVLEAARHATIPSLAATIAGAGAALPGSWWSHPQAQAQAIFTATRALRASAHVLTCRLVDDKITFVHARCWPALVRAADRLPQQRLARLRELHAANGRHRVEATAFPDWVAAQTTAAARHLTHVEAQATLSMLSFLFEQTS